MFTKWYKQMLRAKIRHTSQSGFKAYDGTTFKYYATNYHAIDHFDLALDYALSMADTPDRFNTNGYPMVSFGSGRTEPTPDDFKLESWLENITYTAGNRTCTLADNQDVFSNTFMVTNNGTETIGVSEVGIFIPLYAGSGNASTKYYTMLERSVFEPVYIAPGESATIKYEIVVNYPTE